VVKFAEIGNEIRGGFSQTREMHQLFVDEFDRVRSDIRDIKSTLGPLVRMIAQQEREMVDMNVRLRRVERKVGISDE
jgi:hypothetical protein